ncbi:MAG: dTDP-4-amino-4,6-dideoxygalactose transaminase [Clostridiales bacterium]|nr:dTDP-4-amino-4,6-dideoxygalactose transaminase [Clostridiales bacterium]
MIPFNVPLVYGTEKEHVLKAIASHKLCGDGFYTKRCNEWIESRTGVRKALLTTSGTHALEMAAMLIDIQPGDEVIMPSFTFSSTANAFVLRGARIVFVDIRPDTMNIDENLIEKAITPRTKAICVVHYAGVACNMDKIMKIAKKKRLFVIEDAAQAVMSTYKGKALGSIGDIGCFSFHETKNYNMGEGGALLLKEERFLERAEIIREKGTNRSKFYRGAVDKYTWVDFGSSYLPSELNAAFLWGQLENADVINQNRLRSWGLYYELLKDLEEAGLLELPHIPQECQHNAHMFYIKMPNNEQRDDLIRYLKEKGVTAVFHYVPLHSAPAGLSFGRFFGQDIYTTAHSERLLRLPMYYGLKEEDIEFVVNCIKEFVYSLDSVKYGYYREKAQVF